MNRPILSLAAFAAAALLSGAAEAHAFLDHAIPAVGTTVVTAPAEVTMWFTEPLEPAFSGAAVTDAAGQPVDTGEAAFNPQDPKELHVGLKPLGPGTYKVSWHAVSVDTHRTTGDFSFTVGR